MKTRASVAAFNSGFREDFPLVIRNQRQNLGLSQYQLAEFLKINPNTYRTYELGSRKPKNEVLNRIAQFYDVPVDFYARKPKI
jgi:transcriptional regulator with XRE-family HTH domain